MTPLIEAAELLGIALSLAFSGGCLAALLVHRRATLAQARHVVRSEARRAFAWRATTHGRRLARVEEDCQTHRAALNVHGLMRGSRICPDRAEPPRIFRPAQLNGEEAAS